MCVFVSRREWKKERLIYNLSEKKINNCVFNYHIKNEADSLRANISGAQEALRTFIESKFVTNVFSSHQKYVGAEIQLHGSLTPVKLYILIEPLFHSYISIFFCLFIFLSISIYPFPYSQFPAIGTPI